MQEPGEGEGLDLTPFSDEVRSYLRRAQEIARANAGRYWGPEHVLLAILEEPVWAQAFERLGGNLTETRLGITGSWSSPSWLASRPPEAERPAEPPPTMRMRGLLRDAVANPCLGTDAIGLLTTLATYPAGITCTLLSWNGLTPEVIRGLRQE